MSITALLFLLIYFGGLALAVIKHPKYGLYAYLFAFYLHPPDRWWRAEVPDIRWALYAALVTFALTVIKLEPEKSRTPWFKTVGGKYFILYAVWMLIQTPWAVTGGFHQEGLELFTKYALLFYLIYRLVNTEKEILNFFLVHLLGACYLGWLAYGRDVRGRLEGMGGPGIDDANTFAMHLSTAVAFGAALLLRGPVWVRVLVVATMPFILNGIILAQSRGAFMGLAGAAVLILALRPKTKKLLFFCLGGLGVSLFLALSPPEFFNRMQTITTAVEDGGQNDGAVDTRIAVARAELLMWQDYPLGAGHRGTRVLSPLYLETEYLTLNSEGDGFNRSSHNTVLAVLVDQGLPGILLYVWLIVASIAGLFALKKLDVDKERLRASFALSAYRMGLGGALAVIVVSGMFSNFIKAEVFVWVIALVTCLKGLVDRAVEADKQPSAVTARQEETAIASFGETPTARIKDRIGVQPYTGESRSRTP